MSFVKTGSVTVIGKADLGEKINFYVFFPCVCPIFVKFAIEDIHVIGLSSCELNENRSTGSHNLLKGVQDLSHIPSTFFVRFEVKLATGDVRDV
jgi:hypothetical protein